jgi:hypothetical protein
MDNVMAPDHLREQTCQRCGLLVWQARLDPAVMIRVGYRGSSILLLPHPSQRGNVRLNRAGLAVFTGRFPGDFERHRCPAAVSPCKYCHVPVRVLSQPPGAAEAMAVVDAAPDPRGVVAVNALGYAVHDPDHAVAGDRYRWHDKHE